MPKSFIPCKIARSGASGVDNTDIAGVNRTLTDVALVPHIDWVNAWALGATAKTLEVYGLHSSGSPSPFGIDVNAAGNQQLCVQESELGGMTSLMGYGTPHFRTENVPHFGATYLVTALTDAAADIELRCGYHYEAMI